MRNRFHLLFYAAITFISILSTSGNLFSQTRVVTGTVQSTDGTSLPGATVTVKNTNISTMTDGNGKFELNVSQTNPILVISFVGKISKEVPLGNSNDIAVQLSDNPSELSNVVVVGYGTVKKSDLTGSVSSVSAKDIESVPSTTIEQALQGRAAGVQITQMSGKPGSETSIRIRGTSSINAGNEPLYVIDGMLINSDGGDFSVGGTRGPRISPLASLDPNDIASIEILKDASSTAMYGSRGTNGVILITTKHGKAGKPVINLNTTYGYQDVTKKIGLLDASQFADFVNDAKMNASQTPIYVNPKNLGKGTDWQGELFRRAQIGNYQASISGGTEKIKYSFSGGFFDQDGIIINTNFKRYSFHSNLLWNVSDRLTVGNTLTYSRVNTSGVLTNGGEIVPGVVTSALLFDPALPVFDSTVRGGYTYENDRGKILGNPIAEAREYNSETVLTRLLETVYAQYEVLPYLKFKSSFGIDQYFNNESSYGPSYLRRAEASNGEASLGKTNGLTWLNENTFTFDKSFGSDHHINAVAGYTMQQFNDEKLLVLAFDFPDDRTGYHNIATALKPQKPTNSESRWNMISYLGRVNYTLKDKYLFTLTGRVDGSSKFSEGKKYGFFPSGAFAWRLSNENFMKNVDAINDLKIRVSYGVLGNQSIPPYQSLALVGPFGEGVFNSSAGSEVYTGQEPLSYVNANLKWETTNQLDAGIDLTMFKSRLSFNLDFYQKKTKDLLLSTPIPLTSGFETTLLNVGNIENHGFDFNAHSINIQKEVEWSTDLNFSLNRNKITNLYTNTDIILQGALLLREGQPIGTFYGYQFDGIFQSDQEAANSPVLSGQEPNSPNPASRAKAGDRKYKDQNGDGVINADDRVILGNANPKFTYGLTNTFRYKSFELNFFFQGSYGNKMANFNNYDLLNFTGENNVLVKAALNRWTPDNPGNKYPRALSAGSLDQGVFSSAIVESASYLRLKSLNISYDLAAKVIHNPNIRSLKIFLTGINLFTVTNYSGYDPEANTFGESTTIIGIDLGGYPQARTLQAGISLMF